MHAKHGGQMSIIVLSTQNTPKEEITKPEMGNAPIMKDSAMCSRCGETNAHDSLRFTSVSKGWM